MKIMKKRDLSLPSAAVINAISIASETADWNTLCRYISAAVTHLAIRWDVKDDYVIDEAVSVCYEKVFEYRNSFNPEKGRLTTWLNTVIYSSMATVLKSSQNASVSLDHDDWNRYEGSVYDTDTELDRVEAVSMLESFSERQKGDRGIVARMILDGNSNDEIRMAIGKESNTTNVLKHRVKSDMCRHLESVGFDIRELCA